MIGKVVGTDQITGKIGEGGMGAVFKGIDTMLEREVAIKMLRPDFTRDAESLNACAPESTKKHESKLLVSVVMSY